MVTDKNNIGGPEYFKISGPDRGPDCNILFQLSLGLTKTSLVSNFLTERVRRV